MSASRPNPTVPPKSAAKPRKPRQNRQNATASWSMGSESATNADAFDGWKRAGAKNKKQTAAQRKKEFELVTRQISEWVHDEAEADGKLIFKSIFISFISNLSPFSLTVQFPCFFISTTFNFHFMILVIFRWFVRFIRRCSIYSR
jgi:hypothetical protein